jgi:hypothetical protein
VVVVDPGSGRVVHVLFLYLLFFDFIKKLNVCGVKFLLDVSKYEVLGPCPTKSLSGCNRVPLIREWIVSRRQKTGGNNFDKISTLYLFQ